MNPFAPFASFVPALLRAASPPPRAPVAAPWPAQTRTMHMTIDVASITPLRQLAMRLCGKAFEFMRIATCVGDARIRVWLCVQTPFADLLGAAIAQGFPEARMRGQAVVGAPA